MHSGVNNHGQSIHASTAAHREWSGIARQLATYGLGSGTESQNLPAYLVLRDPASLPVEEELVVRQAAGPVSGHRGEGARAAHLKPRGPGKSARRRPAQLPRLPRQPQPQIQRVAPRRAGSRGAHCQLRVGRPYAGFSVDAMDISGESPATKSCTASTMTRRRITARAASSRGDSSSAACDSYTC